MFRIIHKLTLAVGLALIACAALYSFGAHPVYADAPITNGVLHVTVLTPEGWRAVGTLAYDEYLSEQQLVLPRQSCTGLLVVRVTHTGKTAAHVDAALLDGAAPIHVYGTAEDAALALRKLSAREYDVVDIKGRTLTLVFPSPHQEGLRGMTLALTARIEPERITQTPFQFPLTDLYQTMTPDAAFYTYVWDSQPGALTVDGDLVDEGLGTPFFKEFSLTGTGHPSDYTYGWVRNDADTLYVALDFVPDNTMDGDKDYANVYVNTPTGLRAFKASVPEQTWGMPGFTYTPRAVYQHKVYEFAIPLAELGLTDIAPGDALPLAFAAYGTAGPPPADYPGPLDPTFDDDGIVTTDLGGNDSARGVVIQPDDKIVVVGETDNDFALARYNEDGSLDAGFGGTGVVTTSFGVNSALYAVALQPDDKIVTAGSIVNDFAVARYNSDGSLDNGFGTNGVTTTTFSAFYDGAYAIALQTDGKIVLAGSTSDGDFGLARYNDDGSLDTGFGTNGITTTDFFGGLDGGKGVLVQPDGKIVVAGRAHNGSDYDFALARYNDDGSLDAGFGVSGTVVLDFGALDFGEAVVLQPDGKIVVSGCANNEFALARYDADGSPDSSFGISGVITTSFGGSEDCANGVAIQPDGKIVAAGHNRSYRFAVARYNSDGSLDTSFGTGGLANTDVGSSEYGYEMALQADGKIVIVGNSNNDFALVRYASNQCFAEISGDNITDFSSSDASAVQDALDALAPTSDTVKIAGTCAGVQVRGGVTQTVYISRNVTLQGGYTATNWLATPDPDAYPTTLDAQADGRVIQIDSDAIVTLENLRITNGKTSNNGGGLYIIGYGTDVTIRNSSIFSNTSASWGGGLYVRHSDVHLQGSKILSNTANGNGGGLAHLDSGTTTLDGSQVSYNQAGSNGGALANNWGITFILTDSVVSGNQANNGNGGGLWLINYGYAQIVNSTFISNTASGYGGGLSNDLFSTMALTDTHLSYNQASDRGGGINNDGVLTLHNGSLLTNTVTDSGSRGGGIYLGNNNAVVTQTGTITLAYNRAGNAGGGLYVWDGKINLDQARILSNSAGNSGGALYQGYYSDGISITNSCIVGNSDTAMYYADGPQIGATTNWWGAYDGPSGAGPGGGDSVSSATDIDYSGFLTSAPAGCPVYQHILSVDTAGNGNGMVTADPNQTLYDYGTVVTLTASADTGSTFTGWSGICTGTDDCIVTMTENKSVTATFTLEQYELSVSLDGNGSGSVTSNPTGIDCAAGGAGDCTETFDYGTVVTLTAITDTGSVFTGWSGAGCSGLDDCVVTIDTDQAINATFDLLTHTLTVNVVGSGSVTPDPAGTLWLPTGWLYEYGTVVTLTATPDLGWTLSGWSGDAGGSTTPITVTMDADKTITATFDLLTHTLLTINVVGSGSVTPDPVGTLWLPTGWLYEYGTVVTLTATPDLGWYLSGWSGDVGGSSDIITVTMDADKTITATFDLLTYTLTVNTAGSGTGSVGLDPAGGVYDYGTVVTLTATPDLDSEFIGWSGDLSGTTNPITLTMNGDQAVTATFDLLPVVPTYTLTVLISPTLGGSVILNPSGGVYAENTVVTMTAVPTSGYEFVGWSGDLVSALNPVTVTMTQDMTVTANFDQIKFAIYLPLVLR